MGSVTAGVQHPRWAQRANIYEVNLRQFTPEGTFAAFERHLPRLCEMGVDILWLMPVQPVGVDNRKGSLGSAYSIRDYHAVNPDHGSLDDFKRLVRAAQGLGMHVILDWVANHTAWDHHWVRDHPDWYLKDAQGEIHSYVYDNGHELEHWTDVVGLDWRNPALWDGMTDAMKFWVTETGIDGYRCDVAGLVPTPFWERLRAELDAIKPVFMLAEWSDARLHERAFDMTYDWALQDVMKKIARGEGGPADLVAYLDQAAQTFPRDAYRMTFTSNHDKNTWEGHDVEVFGASFQACAVLAATLPGMPLVYGGQEAVLDKRLAFFDQDTIDWKGSALAGLYAGLLRLKHEHPALANGAAGAPAEMLACDNPAVFAFRRALAADVVRVAVNLSAQPQDVQIQGMDSVRHLAPWGYCIDS
jgi:glycosidase